VKVTGPDDLAAVSPTLTGLLALLLAIPSCAAIALGTYRLMHPALERAFGLSSEDHSVSPPRFSPIELIALGAVGLLATGALTTLLLTLA
jgi:hypothetical protein